MKNSRILIRGIAAACAMLVLILDAGTATASAYKGISLCIRTVIPSLFPFFVLSGVINSALLGQELKLFRPLGRLCKIPKGTESLLVLGFLAGYPIGAQLINQAYRDGQIQRRTALRMLGFGSNAGPAFLFGMLTPLFTAKYTVWVLWGILLLSALLTGWVLPGEETEAALIIPERTITFSQSFQAALKAIASVCGWVIVFRVILGFCDRWFLWLFPAEVQVLISGALELANGCAQLQNLPREGMRFIVSAVMLSFGGLCVGMQTVSVTDGLGTGWYFPGKALQTVLALLLCLAVQPIVFDNVDAVAYTPSVLIGLSLLSVFLVAALRRKKVVAFSGRLLYNTDK